MSTSTRTSTKEVTEMTTFGLDVSHYQSKLDLDAADLKRQGYAFVMVKATEGATYRDPAYHTFREQAEREGLLFAAYHFLAHGNIAAQVDNLIGFVDDPSIPIMLDVEAYGATLADAREFRTLAKAKGRRVSLLYLPHWYWERIGSPSLLGWAVVASSYPSKAHQFGSALYLGAKASGWAAYGGVKPVIWQFASSGKVDGYSGNVDLDAFEGNATKLRTYFKSYDVTPAPKLNPAPKPTAALRLGFANMNWGTGQAKDEQIIADLIHYGAVFLGLVEAKVDNVRHMVPAGWAVAQSLANPAKKGSVAAWSKKAVKVTHARPLRLGVNPGRAKMLPRWLRILDVDIDGREARVIVCHRPPARFKRLWPVFDAAVKMRLRTTKAGRAGRWVVMADANEPIGTWAKTLGGTGHGTGIVGIITGPALKGTRQQIDSNIVARKWTDHDGVILDVENA